MRGRRSVLETILLLDVRSLWRRLVVQGLLKEKEDWLRQVELTPEDIIDVGDLLPELPNMLKLGEGNVTKPELIKQLRNRLDQVNIKETVLYNFNTTIGYYLSAGLALLAFFLGMLYQIWPKYLGLFPVGEVTYHNDAGDVIGTSAESFFPGLLVVVIFCQVIYQFFLTKQVDGWRYTKLHFELMTVINRFERRPIEALEGFDEVGNLLAQEWGQARRRVLWGRMTILMYLFTLVVSALGSPIYSWDVFSAIATSEIEIWAFIGTMSAAFATAGTLIVFLIMVADDSIDFDAGQKMGLMEAFQSSGSPMTLDLPLSEVIESLLDPITAMEWIEQVRWLDERSIDSSSRGRGRALEKLLLCNYLSPLPLNREQLIDEIKAVYNFERDVNHPVSDDCYIWQGSDDELIKRYSKKKKFVPPSFDDVKRYCIKTIDKKKNVAIDETPNRNEVDISDLDDESLWVREESIVTFLDSPEYQKLIFSQEEIKRLLMRGKNTVPSIFKLIDRAILRITQECKELAKDDYYFDCEVDRKIPGVDGRIRANLFVFVANQTGKRSKLSVDIHSPNMLPEENTFILQFNDEKSMTYPESIYGLERVPMSLGRKREDDVLGIVSTLLETGTLLWIQLQPKDTGDASINIRLLDDDDNLIAGYILDTTSTRAGPKNKQGKKSILVGIAVPLVKLIPKIRSLIGI
jgi:hypothetical protein